MLKKCKNLSENESYVHEYNLILLRSAATSIMFCLDGIEVFILVLALKCYPCFFVEPGFGVPEVAPGFFYGGKRAQLYGILVSWLREY